MARIGAPRIFFNVVGSFQAAKMLDDASSQMTILNSIFMDGLGGIEDAAVALAEQMTMVVEATVPLSMEIEKATLEFEKFLSVGDEVKTRLAGEIMGIGAEVGFTAEQSLSAGARMAQLSGIFGDEVIPAATEMALAFGLIGDMAPEDAMLKLINLQQQTNFVFDKTSQASYNLLTAEQQRLQVQKEMSRVINQLNSVEDKSAATMSKIVRVMNEFASQARLTGEEISFMAAMSATLIEAGEEQGKAGRARRMIYARLGADTNGAATALHNLGIATTNADGSLRPLSDILADLGPQYEEMANGQKQQLAQQVAGNLHYVRFLKLAEGFDRVLALQREAAMETGAVFTETGEATGVLADKMEANSTQLEKARAELDAVNATLGDQLIPSIINATTFQTQFNQTLIEMLENSGPVGDAFAGIFGFQQKMSTTFAPFFTMNLNLKALMISLATMRQIQRAMDGEMLARQQVSMTGHEKDMMMMKEMGTQHNKKIGDLQQEKQVLDSINITRNRAIGNVKKLGSVEHLAAERNEAFQKRKRIFAEEGIALTTRNIQQLDIEDAKRERLTLALDEQIAAERRLAVAIDARTAQLPALIAEEQRYQMTLGENAIFLDDETDSIQRNTNARKAGNLELSESALRSAGLSNRLMFLGGATMVADMAVMGLSKHIDDMTKKGTAAKISVALTAIQMGIMMAETVITTGAIMALSRAQGANAAATNVQAGAINRAATATGRLGKAAIATSKIFVRFLPIIAAVGLVLFAVQKRYKVFGEESSKAAKGAEVLNEKLRETELLGKRVKLSSAVDASGMANAAQEIEDFAGAREEMFFGFKAGAVTGDLVKQVQVGGVENFVANTEVIMTNNFNGLTTEEMADTIMSEIESRMIARDIPMTVRG